jgi:DNA polymerase elongation subunit (family B)
MDTEICIHAYDWQTSTDSETGYTMINCWGFDRDSKPHLLRFHEFDVFCYIELPMYLNNALVNWAGFREKMLFDKICDILGEDKPYRYRFEKKEKLYFYRGKNRTYPMLLLCFRSISSMNVCRNKLKHAFKVYGLRGGNKKGDETMVAVRVWESQIPLVRKMLTLRNCNFSQWFKINGIKVQGNDKISILENEFVVDWKTLNPISQEETISWLTQPTIFSYDIETYTDRHNAMPDPLCSKHVVYLISVVFQRSRDPSTRKTDIILFGDCSDTKLANVIKVKTEMELIDVLQELVVKYNPDITIGYNIYGYDNFYIETRLKRRLKEWKPIGRLINKPSAIKTISWNSSAYKNQDFNILEMDGRISIDMLPVIRRDHKLPLYNLDFVSKHFLGKGKYDVKPKQMFEIYELQECLFDTYNVDEGKIPDSFINLCTSKEIINIKDEWKKEYRNYALDEMKKVVEYCVVDSDLVLDLFEKINVWIGLIQMSNIMGITPSEIFTRGTGIRMQSKIYDEAFKNNVVLDEVDFPSNPYEGGFVFPPVPGIYHNIPCLDFSSLYPSIMRAYNIDHRTCVPPELMDKIPDEECHVIEWTEEHEEDEDSDSEDESNDKKKSPKQKKTTHYKYKFVKEPMGLMPKLLGELITERNNVRKKQKDVPEESLEWNILEQTQLAIKTVGNSFYGSCGSSYSNLKQPQISASITARARESTKKMNAYLESKGHKIVYGDSVTGDTPILILKKGIEEYVSISDLFQDENDDFEKHYKIPEILTKVWSDKGFTEIKYVMKHRTKKRIFCIVTTSGIIKVTEDHSLLNPDGIEISPKNLKVGDFLLIKEHSKIKSDLFSEKIFEFESGIDANNFLRNCKNFNVNYEYNGNYKISFSKEEKEKGKILNIIDMGIVNDYVYDLETENHHFSAGVGELVVHNTDSTMPDIGIKDTKTAWEVASKLSKELTALYPDKMNVELEAIFSTMLCIKKKMYLCIYMDKNGEPIEDPNKMKIRGVTLARRDNCKFQREFYKSTVWKVMHTEPFINVFNFIIDKCLELLQRQVPWQDLTMIKGLGANYKSPTYMMALFANEMQKTGNPLVPGDRITYLVIKNGDDIKDESKLGMKMRTSDVYLERSESGKPEHIDYMYYLEKTVKNGIEKQLYQVGYKKELDELENKYLEMDQNKLFYALGKKITNLDKNPEIQKMRIQGYNQLLLKLFAQFDNDKSKVIDHLLEDDSFKKIIKPLYSFIIKRRKGRGRRLSSRIDREPIMMMVRIAQAKAEVMRSIRDYAPKPKEVKKKLVLKVIKSIN